MPTVKLDPAIVFNKVASSVIRALWIMFMSRRHPFAPNG